MKRIAILFLALLALTANAFGTTVTLSASQLTTLPFNPTNIGTTRTFTVSVTNGSATVTSAALFPSNIVGIGGFQILIGSTQYVVSGVASTSSLTLTTNYSGSTGSATLTLYPYVLLKAYATAGFQDNVTGQNIQPGTPGSGNFYKQIAVSIINSGSGNVAYLPEFTLPSTTDALINNQARYVFGFYRTDGSLLSYYVCGSVQQLAVPPSTPTTWTALCNYNSPGGVVPPNNEVYTKGQIDQRFPNCSQGQSYYFAANGNIVSCLNFGSGLTLAGNTLTASGGGGSTTDYRGAINVSKTPYSCAGDGVTSDQTCLQNAINAAAAAGGKIVYIPAGTYLVTGLSVPGGVTLEGDGMQKSIIKSATNATIVDAVEGSGSYAFLGPTIRNLKIQGSGSGGSQIGLKADDGLYYAQGVFENIQIYQAGSHGLYVGNAFSSRFVNIYSDDNGGFPFYINSANMPSNHYESLYAQETNSGGNAGFRVLAGNFICISCNGINASASGSWNAIIGQAVASGDASNVSAFAQWINCNFESAKAGGIDHRYNSVSTFSGHNQFAGDAASSGAYIAMRYAVDAALFPPYFAKGKIDDSTVFANSPASFYTNSQPIHANDLPPLTIDGQGPKVAGGNAVSTYRNTTSSTVQQLYRADAYYPTVAVTTSTSFTNPGPRYFEVTCGSNCTLTLPWPGWYSPGGEQIVVKNLSASGVVVTLAANSGGSVNTPNGYSMSEQYQSVTLMPDSTALDYRVLSSTTPPFQVQAYNVKLDGKCVGDGVANDTSCVAAAYTAAIAASRPLYFPTGTYLVDGGTLSIATNSVIIFGDGPGRSTIRNRTAGAAITLNNAAAITHSITIRDLSLVGVGSGSSDVGLLVTSAANEPYGLTVSNVTIGNVAGRGIYVTNNLFTSRFVDVDVSVLAAGTNGIDISGGADILLERCYVHSVGTGGAAYRIHAGFATFIACNGIDSGTTADWIVLGDSIATGDPSDRFARVNLISTNIEAFTNRGVYAKTGSYVNKFEGVTILAPPSGTVTPIKYDFVDTGQRGTWDAASSINTGGATYTNGNAINSNGAPFVQIGNTSITDYYDTGAVGILTLPYVTAQLVAGSTNIAMLTSRAQITNLESSGLVGDLTGNTSFTGDAARVLLQDGSASRPTFTFSGDTNTGFFRSTTDTIGFASGGANLALFGTTGFILLPYGASAGNTGQIALREIAPNGTDAVTLRAPDSIASSFSLTLPNALPGSTLCLAFSNTGAGSFTACSGGSGSPGGSDTQIQYNSAGSFAGISGFTSDGTNVTAGSANLRATRPRITTSLDDSSGNELFVFTATASAVNEITLANAATGNNPTFTASGGDTNVGINFVPKGSGTIQVSGVPIVTTTATQTLTNKTLTASSNVLGGVTMTLGSDATGDVYYRNSGGVLTRLAIGSSGNCLTVAAGLPSWSSCGTGTITGSGTTGTIAKFTGSSAVGDSILTESSTTLTTAGRQTINGLTISTDATNTVASLTANSTFTKNNTNSRTFYGVLVKPTFNFGGSNANTEVNLLQVDSTNTATTGTIFNLLHLKFGGSTVFNVDSAGAITFANGVRQAFVPDTVTASLNVGQVASDPSSGVNGDVVYQTGTNKFRCYENSAWTNCIGSSGGSGTVTSVAQSFTGGLISVSGSPVTSSGTLALTVAGTSGGIPYFSSASTWASSAALAANAIVLGGGAGAAPATTTTGTGVVTALGVNVGSAGAFVVNGGALGTPSSGTLTNATGLPPTTGISGWPANASGCLSNNGSGTLSWAACSGGSGITIGTTTITSGTNTRVLYNNSGVVGEYTVSGSGNVAMTTSPTFTTPTLGVASATSINKVTITAPATSATLTIADGKTLTASNTLTFTGTDSSSVAFGSGGTVVYTGAVTGSGLTMATARLLGRSTASTGAIEEITIGSGLNLSAGTLSATGGGSGTVTSFSSGNLSPLFTTSVANATTTPALSFSLSNAAANTYFGNATGSTAAPSFTAAGALTKTDDTNVTLTLGGSPSTALLNAASITVGWTGTLAAGRLNSNVVQAITNDTNITGSISAQTLTLGFTGTLAKARQNAATVYNDAANTFSTGAQSFAAATSMVIPTGAGAAPTANATIAYDSTANAYKFGVNGSTKTVLMTDGSGASLTNLNASNLSSGTVPLTRLSGITTSELSATAGITNGQLAGGIAYSKLSLTGSIVNADISASAAITDDKLAQITTADKVADSALSVNVPLLNTSNTFTAVQNVAVDDSATNAVTNLLDLRHSSTGSAAANFGSGIRFGLESTTTANRDAGRLNVQWSTATDASRTAKMVVQLVNSAAALADKATFDANGNLTITGVYIAGSAPTTLTDSTGKILSAALNTVAVAQGGTGATTLTGVLKGNGTSAFTAAVAGTDYVAPGAVTTSGLTMTTARILGRSTASTGAIEEITIGSGLSLSAGTLSATGGGSGITVGTTTITSGTSGRVPYNNGGVYGEISGFTSDGTNVTAGSGNLLATRPRITTSLDDSSGNELLVLTATASAVNEITLANAATGNNPTFTASGGDTNVGINFAPKGSGTIQVSGVPIVTTTATQTLTNKTLTAPVIATISNTGTLTLPTSTDTLVGKATTDTFTNKTYDTSATGNVFSMPVNTIFLAAGCNNTTAGTAFDIPTSGGATSACLGTTTTQGVLEFADGSTTAATNHMVLPTDFTITGGVDVRLTYTGSTNSTNNIRFQVSCGCIADNEDAIGVAYNTGSASNTAGPATAGLRKSVTFTNVAITGCAAGETLYLKIERIGADGGDTYTGIARLMEMEVVYRRSM